MSNEIVERVARALYCEDEGMVEAHNMAHLDHWFGPDCNATWPAEYRVMARAAIEAMRDYQKHNRMASNPYWLHVKPQNGGVLFTFSEEPLDFVWQDREQAEDIAKAITAALGEN